MVKYEGREFRTGRSRSWRRYFQEMRHFTGGIYLDFFARPHHGYQSFFSHNSWDHNSLLLPGKLIKSNSNNPSRRNFSSQTSIAPISDCVATLLKIVRYEIFVFAYLLVITLSLFMLEKKYDCYEYYYCWSLSVILTARKCLHNMKWTELLHLCPRVIISRLMFRCGHEWHRLARVLSLNSRCIDEFSEYNTHNIFQFLYLLTL